MLNKEKIYVLSVILFLATTLVISGCTSSLTGEAKGGVKGGGKKEVQCNDHIDNDGDGKCDFLWRKAFCNDGSIPGDPGCISKDDNDESSDCIPACNTNGDCGTNGYVGNPYCGADGNVYRDYKTYVCENAGKCSAVCNNHLDGLLWQYCTGYGCTAGQCNDPPGNNTNKSP